MRKHIFTIGEYYHIYNRGVDKRDIVKDEEDVKRFIQSFILFNTTEPIGSIYELFHRKEKVTFGPLTSKLVTIVTYCLNPNHFHLLLTPLIDKGIEKFMQRLGGYTKYFNEKYERSGSLFQGTFKSRHVINNEYLLHVSAYINMNNRDIFGTLTSKLSRSGLEEYMEISNQKGFCETRIILDQFQSNAEYTKFAQNSWRSSQELKDQIEQEFN